MRAVFWAGVLGLAASQVGAGAWSREKGTFFVASASNIALEGVPQEELFFDPTLYIEYGATERLTLGLDYFATEQDLFHNAILFARFPLGDPQRRHKLAASIGLGGQIRPDGEVLPLLQGGLSWGVGLENGWLAVDSSGTYNEIDDAFLVKTDFTWGQNLGKRWTVVSQLQTGEGREGVYFAKFSPSVVFSVTDGLRVSLGAVQSLSGDEPTALRFGVWQMN